MRLTSKKFPKGTRVSGIIFSSQKDQVALMERHREGRHYFAFPGGGVEDLDKTVVDTLKREMKEELGIEIQGERRMYEIHIGGHSKQIFFICETKNETLRLTGEELEKNSTTDQYKPVWVKIGELSQLVLFPIEIRDWLVEDLKKGNFTARKQVFDSMESMKSQ